MDGTLAKLPPEPFGGYIAPASCCRPGEAHERFSTPPPLPVCRANRWGVGRGRGQGWVCLWPGGPVGVG